MSKRHSSRTYRRAPGDFVRCGPARAGESGRELRAVWKSRPPRENPPHRCVVRSWHELRFGTLAMFRASRSALLASVAVVAACSADSQSVAPRASGGVAGTTDTGGEGGGGTVDPGDPTAPGACVQAVDIVFVMDVSTSMGPFLEKLAAEIPVVDQAVQALNLTAPAQYGLVVFVDDTEFVNSGAAYQSIAALRQDFLAWANFTSQGTQIDPAVDSFSMPENSLDALHRAAVEFAWRPAGGTLRVVIHTTDDEFWDGPTTTPEGVLTLNGYAATVEALQKQQVRVFSFAAKWGGEDENQDVSAGWFAPFQGMTSIPEATGGVVFELDQVLKDQISLAASINDAVADAHCQPYPAPH